MNDESQRIRLHQELPNKEHPLPSQQISNRKSKIINQLWL